MATLYIMVGIPASGKSTYANKLATELGCNIHSSDAIRRELCGTQQDLSRDKEMWKILKERMCKDLSSGKDCIVDATNGQSTKRINYINRVISEGIDCKKVAIVANPPFEVCLERNKSRNREQRIPYKSMLNLKRVFEEPTLSEGFDEIIKIEN